MKQASIFLVMVITLGLASCSQGSFGGGGSVFGSLLSSDEAKQDGKPQSISSTQQASTTSTTQESRPTRVAAKPRRTMITGGIVKSLIGKKLNSADLSAASEAEYQALEYGKPGVATPWRNPKNGRYGSVVTSDKFRQNNIYCRKYTHTVYISGRPQVLRGFACRNRDGSWENLG
ncbi:MAG: RT0821/Lpp0805 family surface protein [Methyloligellaceae bacterium]